MTEQEFKDKITERWGEGRRNNRKGRRFVGVFLLVVGGLLLLRALGTFEFPTWLFTWPVFLMAFAITMGAANGFRRGFWIVPFIIGVFLFANQIDPELSLQRFIVPLVLIIGGLVFIMKPRPRWSDCNFPEGPGADGNRPENDQHLNVNPQQDYKTYGNSIDVTAVFGGVKKIVVSKQFQGGEIVSFMGGSEIDLTQSDFSGRISIDATNIFGGTKLLIPSSWEVHNNITAVFGGVDDRRQMVPGQIHQGKTLVLEGTCVFGGIEIRSFA